MRFTSVYHFGIALLVAGAALPAMADTQFRIRQMTRDDVPLGKGQCDIRLQVDNEVEVAVYRDTVSIRTISGRDARDDGSECNAPLPDRDLRDFNFEVKDSRGDIRLLEPPDRRNRFTAIVRIRDSSGGEGRYHFRLTWAMAGGPPPPPESFPRRDDRPYGDRPGPPPVVPGFAWNNVIHFSAPGRGESSLTGVGSQRLFEANVDIDRGGRIIVSFRTDSGRPITFSGTIIDRQRDMLKADVAADERMLRLRGPMWLTVDREMNTVFRIALETDNGRDRLHLEWNRR